MENHRHQGYYQENIIMNIIDVTSPQYLYDVEEAVESYKIDKKLFRLVFNSILIERYNTILGSNIFRRDVLHKLYK